MFWSFFGQTILIQFSSLQTVIGQANGSKQYRLARIYLHRQYVITGITCLFLLIPLCLCRQILTAIGQ
jgi:Na+-driven multidrug efflux pump